MPRFKPRSKRSYRKALRTLRVSSEVREILVEIASELEGAYSDAMNELQDAALTTLYAVKDEPVLPKDTRKAVQRLIKKLKGKP